MSSNDTVERGFLICSFRGLRFIIDSGSLEREKWIVHRRGERLVLQWMVVQMLRRRIL
jgi:hypothetical protein